MTKQDQFGVYWDDNELITEKDGNGGDSANRMGLYMWLWWSMFYDRGYDPVILQQFAIASRNFTNAVPKLEPYPFVYIRHPNRSKDEGKKGVRDFAEWNNWTIFSRDQLLPLLTGIAISNLAGRYHDDLKTLKRRWGICPNGDILGPYHWCHLHRLKRRGSKRSFGIICLYGLSDLFVTLFCVLKMALTPLKDTSDSLVGFMIILTAAKIHPTWVSKFNLWLAKKLCRIPKRWEIYFSGPNSCQLHNIAQPLFKKYL